MRVAPVLTAFALLATLAACKSTTTSSGTPAPAGPAAASAATPSAAPSASTAPESAAPSAPASAATGALDACTVVGPADATTLLGAAAGTGRSLPAGVFQSCIYGNGKFIVLVRHVDQATFDQSAKANPGGAVPVTGIGQDAYVVGGTDLLFWQNGTEVSMHGPALAKLKLLAPSVASSL